MKTKLFAALTLVFSLSAFSSVIPYEPSKCLPLDEEMYTHGELKLTNGLDLDVDAAMDFMTKFVNQIEFGFLMTKDPYFLYRQKPLCLAVYIEKPERGPNAGALGDDVLIYGVNFMLLLMRDFKLDPWTSLKAIMAHEYAHVLQSVHGIKFNNIPDSLVIMKSRAKELHADCVAAILLTIHDPHQAAQLPLNTKLMEMIGGHHSVTDHGSKVDRPNSFIDGLKQGLLMVRGKGKSKANTTSLEIVNACLNI